MDFIRRVDYVAGLPPSAHVHSACDRGLLQAECGKLLGQRRIGRGEHGNCEKRRVRGAGLAYRKGRHRYSLGHLHDGQERILTAQVFGRNRHAQHGHGGLGGKHAGQVRRTARASDDHAQASRRRVFRVFEHLIGHPVRRHDARLVGHAERVKLRYGMAHHVPIAFAAHHDPDQRCCLALCHPSSRSAGSLLWHPILASGQGLRIQHFASHAFVLLWLAKLDRGL
jgi:hypothetical protein